MCVALLVRLVDGEFDAVGVNVKLTLPVAVLLHDRLLDCDAE